ncbi:4-hydroxybenzoate octaprenyltransferase [Enterovirga sp. CN4-39]|uniref:4-hydroxybenzoate octaprenyltransferase n=1 Tax=Enterovirga sp. CN4-39 TaxID=3400910 RepID=UPI003BFF9F3D
MMGGSERLRVADAPRWNPVDSLAPEAWKPWLRLGRYDRPIGSWLLMWPCWWSAALAAHAAGRTEQLPWHLLLFFVGAFVMRAAGSIWNDILDRKIDARVERTKLRPLASGQISVKAALAFAIAHSLLGLLILVQFNAFAIALGCLSLVPVAAYPLMKRFFSMPQAVFGLCFAWGALMGWAAVFGSLSAAPVLMYWGAYCWCIGYDTVYGHQDQRDDAIIGVRSTSRTFGRYSRAIIAGLYGGAVLLVGLALWQGGASWPGYAGLAAFAAHLAQQVVRLDPEDPPLCLRLFRSNRDAGCLLFLGLAADLVI